jgi:hypothetical protein
MTIVGGGSTFARPPQARAHRKMFTTAPDVFNF